MPELSPEILAYLAELAKRARHVSDLKKEIKVIVQEVKK